MAPNIPESEKSPAIDQVDGWLRYDFHGSNPIAVSLAGLAGWTVRRPGLLGPADACHAHYLT